MGLVKLRGSQAGFRRGFAAVDTGSNRVARRREAAKAGLSWSAAQQAHYFREGAAKAEENIALRMTPREALEMLAKWAAIPGRTQEEVDAMNAGAANAKP